MNAELTTHLLYFIVLLNPFGQAIFLWELMNKLTPSEFSKIYFKASLLSFGVYFLFILTGEFIVTQLFQIRLPSLQLFGGLIMVGMSLRTVIMGNKTHILLRTESKNLPSEISLPYIIGPSTLWLSIIIGKNQEWVIGTSAIAGLMIFNWAALVLSHLFITNLNRKKESILMKYFGVLMRTTSLFIGAIGVEMIVSGIAAMFK